MLKAWIIGGLSVTKPTKSKMMYARKMMKKRAVPISDGLVETVSSLGTGMKEKMSMNLSALRQMLGWSSEMKEEEWSL